MMMLVCLLRQKFKKLRFQMIDDTIGKERHRIEGYLPRAEFAAQLELGLARIAFMGKKWDEAERRYKNIVQQYGSSPTAAEAIYWSGVASYKRTIDHTVLRLVSRELEQHFPNSLWARKASVWAARRLEQAS
jgi:outer membrane protein assembly factor BamD (BamD/ComL family)